MNQSARNYVFLAAAVVVSLCLLIVPSALAMPQQVDATAQPSAAIPEPGARPHFDERYRIGPADVLEVRVFERPQLTRENVRVDGNGHIRLPLMSEEIVAACLSESELAAEVALRYREYLKNPQVEVFVKQFSSQPVAVVGSVMRPGSFQLERRVRLRELITLAGGPSSSAGKTLQIIHDENAPACDNVTPRPLPQMVASNDGMVPVSSRGAATDSSETLAPPEPDVLTVDLHALMRGTGINPYIRPGDFVSVPVADQAFVVGNVFKPAAIDLNQPLTLSRAVAMAGGTLPSTKRSAIHIVRASPFGNVESTFDLGKIEQHSAPDPLLQAGDIVEVPTSLGKQIIRGTFTTIVPAYAIYYPLTLIH